MYSSTKVALATNMTFTFSCHPDVFGFSCFAPSATSISMFRELPSRLNKEDSERILLLHLHSMS